MKAPITTEQAARELQAIAADRPDFVYEAPEDSLERIGSCFYVHGLTAGGVPTIQPEGATEWVTGCLIGEWLHVSHGVSLEDLRRVNMFGTEYLFDSLGIERERGVLKLADQIQVRQDNGLPWGKAVAEGLAAWRATEADGNDSEGES